MDSTARQWRFPRCSPALLEHKTTAEAYARCLGFIVEPVASRGNPDRTSSRCLETRPSKLPPALLRELAQRPFGAEYGPFGAAGGLRLEPRLARLTAQLEGRKVRAARGDRDKKHELVTDNVHLPPGD
jgi:hypothetical protein